MTCSASGCKNASAGFIGLRMFAEQGGAYVCRALIPWETCETCTKKPLHETFTAALLQQIKEMVEEHVGQEVDEHASQRQAHARPPGLP